MVIFVLFHIGDFGYFFEIVAIEMFFRLTYSKSGQIATLISYNIFGAKIHKDRLF